MFLEPSMIMIINNENMKRPSSLGTTPPLPLPRIFALKKIALQHGSVAASQMQKFNWPTSKIALRICQVFLLLGSVSLNDILYM